MGHDTLLARCLVSSPVAADPLRGHAAQHHSTHLYLPGVRPAQRIHVLVNRERHTMWLRQWMLLPTSTADTAAACCEVPGSAHQYVMA